MLLAADFGNGDVLLWFIEIFFLVLWLWLLIAIIGDLFRDREASGWAKALWVLFVIVLPFVGILVYLVVRGRGMAERSAASRRAAQDQLDAYIREQAGSGGSPADQIARAKSLLDAGVIEESEFARPKEQALA